MSNSILLSKHMLKSEKSVAYSTSVAAEVYSRGNICQFTICTSESQGFSWNQDIFASQYQQLCKVIYDGHVDSVDKLLQKVLPPKNGEKDVYVDVFNDDEMDQDTNYINPHMYEDDSSARKANYDEWRYRISKELNKPRRRSERSISFVSDSKNGTYHSADVVEIDVESPTPENTHLRELVKEV